MRALICVLLLAGCAPTTPLVATAVQPHPRQPSAGDLLLNASQPLYVFTSANGAVRVRNSAQFVAITRDLVRFHVGVRGSTRDWKVRLEDERGTRYLPAAREVAEVERLAIPWWKAIELQGGCGYATSALYDNVVVEYGSADYVFRSPGLMGPQRKSVTLVLEHPRQRAMRFVWTFGDGTDVHHRYYGRVDREAGFLSIPGPGTVRLASRFEDGALRYQNPARR